MSTPILLLSDCPSQSSGLARITRDLATLLTKMPEFRVGTLGWMGTGSARLPWAQYHMQAGEYGHLTLPQVWDEFAQGQAGIVWAIWDATRLLWLGRPEFVEEPEIRSWLEDARRRKFKVWGYFPFDATGPGGRFTSIVKDTLLGFDRIVVPSPVAAQWVRDTIGQEEAERRGLTWLPHGISGRVWTPQPRVASRVPLIGCVATNQVRKELALWGSTCAGLAERLKGQVKFWLHTDVPSRHWSVPAIVADFGLGEYVEVTYPPVDDSWLAGQYRRCACTFLPSTGEGFGYPLFESLACGTPVVHGDYAGGASLMRAFGLESLLVPPSMWRAEGIHNCVRPVYQANDFVDRIVTFMGQEGTAPAVAHLDWMKLGHTWKKWLREGLL